MTANNIKHNFRMFDDIAAELLSVIAPYGLGAVSIVMIALSASDKYKILTNWNPWGLGIVAFFIVVSGLAIYATTFDILFSDKLTSKWIKATMLICSATYATMFALLVLGIKLDVSGNVSKQVQQMLPFAAMVFLDGASIINLVIRRKTYHVAKPRKSDKKTATKGQMSDNDIGKATQKRQDKATERQTIAREMSRNGRDVSDIATELNVTTRTVERYLNGKRNEATS